MLNSVEQTLFESTNARFALKINVMTTKKNTQTNQVVPLITLSQMGNAKLRPNAFLVFTYMTDEFETTKSVFTSNPHMPKIKAIVRMLKDAILHGDAFIQHDGILSVNERYSEEYAVTNIGAKQHYIVFKLRADGMVDTNNNFMPSVEIRLSEAPESCILSIDEFLAIYEIIEQVNLPIMAMEVGLAELVLGNRPAQANQSNQRPQSNYGNNGYNNGGGRRTFQTPAQAQPAYVPQQQHTAYAPSTSEGTYTQTVFQPKQATQQPYAPRQQQPAQAPAAPKPAEGQKLQPRSKPMVNGAAVSEVEVDDLDLGDTGLSDLFGE